MRTDPEPHAAQSAAVPETSASRKPLPHEADVFGITHAGRTRPTNADHFLVASFYRTMTVHASSIEASTFPPVSTYSRGFLFLVADGVGALSQAAEGSAQAIQAVSQHVLDMSEVSLQTEPSREAEVAERMRTFVLKAHELLRGEAKPDAHGSNATTFTMAIGIWPRWFVIHVGDSRAYLFRRGELRRLTKDQTMAQAMIDSGAMTRQVAESSRLKHVLVSALGSSQLEPELSIADIEWGGAIFLCSDGLTRHVSDEEIRTRLTAVGTSEAVCRDLLNLALERGGLDNITVVMGQIPLK